MLKRVATKVIDGDTFIVDKGVSFRGETYEKIWVAGYDAPELNTEEGKRAQKWLSDLILYETVEIGEIHDISTQGLVCDVYFGDKKLQDQFRRNFMVRRLRITESSYPNVEILIELTVEALKEIGKPATVEELNSKVAEIEALTDEELSFRTGKNSVQTKFYSYSSQARTILKHCGALNRPNRGVWDLTVLGKKLEFNENMSNEMRQEYLQWLSDSRDSKIQTETNEIQYRVKPTMQILYGPPGTSKTYDAVTKAVAICLDEEEKSQFNWKDRDAVVDCFRRLQNERRIEFVTFHQSYSYEEFVEGLRPTIESEITDRENMNGYIDSSEIEDKKLSVEPNISGGFRLKPRYGIFIDICRRALRETREMNLDRSRPVFQIAVKFKWRIDDNPIQNCLKKSIIQNELTPKVDWTDSEARTVDEFKMEWRKNSGDDFKDRSRAMGNMFTFRHKLKEGDYVILADGYEKFVAIGEIAGQYYYDNSESYAPHKRKVNWLWKNIDGVEREDIYSRRFLHFSTYQLNENLIDWDMLDQIVYRDNFKSRINAQKSYVLIIDEINRANISKIFGELITLLETDKRISEKNEIQVRLPYSGMNFGVPTNLHIIGTMNTADRSIALMDSALRRRFNFEEREPIPSLVQKDIEGIKLRDLFIRINDRIENLIDREHRIGHAFFIDCESKLDVSIVFRNKIIPLLEEYFYDDKSMIVRVLEDQIIKIYNGDTIGKNETSTFEKLINEGVDIHDSEENFIDLNEYSEDDEIEYTGCFFKAKQIKPKHTRSPKELQLNEIGTEKSRWQWKVRKKFIFELLGVS